MFIDSSKIIGRMAAGHWLVLAAGLCVAAGAAAADLRVMPTGVGAGSITGAGIACGGGGSDCTESLAASASVTLTATAGLGSTFAGWGGDCTGTAATCTVAMNVVRSVRARFDLTSAPAELADFTPEGIAAYLGAHPAVNTPARFISVLPREFRQNWILMPRSESLQTGTPRAPRVLLPSADAQRVFTVGMRRHSAYPGAHPNAIEYMQWDAGKRNFRFHEIVLDAIPAMGDVIAAGPPEVRRFPPRSRGVSIDDPKCFACHSTRNVLNRGTTPATDGVPPGSLKAKSKPNWDTYDSWGGMLSFNRDRIYQGSAEAAALRALFNPWTWIGDAAVRSVLEQLELQPPGVPADHTITREAAGGADDGRIRLGFDPAGPPVTTEPAPVGSEAPASSPYAFDRTAGAGPASDFVRGGSFVTLHQSTQVGSDEGRGVELFDRLSTGPNPIRIADELIDQRHATGSVPFDPRPLALAVAQRCIVVDGGTDLASVQTITSTPALPPATVAALPFFNARHGIASFDALYDETRLRAWSLTRRKADIQKLLLDRTGDPYEASAAVAEPEVLPPDGIGLVAQYGAATASGVDAGLPRLRQEIFRRPPTPVSASTPEPAFKPDRTVMGGIYVDRELISNTAPVALFRYFLEPLGVSVDKWSMGVRGRSRTYTFADLFGGYSNRIAADLKSSLGIDPSLSFDDTCAAVIALVDASVAALPPATGAGAVPRYTDIQRIFNKSCIECHGGLGYPPYHNHGTYLDLSENEAPPPGDRRMTRSYNVAQSLTSPPTGPMGTDVSNSYLFQRITGSTTGVPPHLYDPLATNEDCPYGIMPCGGPPLSSADIETIRRWIIGGRPFSEGDPHVRTVDGTSYDFQAAGEFVLLRDEGMELQVRQTPVTTAGPLGPNAHTGLSSCVSINTAVAMRVGAHRVSYQPAVRSRGDDVQRASGGLLLRVDGKPVDLAAGERLLAGGGRITATSAAGGVQVEYPGGTVVVVTPGYWAHHQVWYLNLDVRHARATDGVMGTIGRGQWLPALPDGTLLGPRPSALPQRYEALYKTFADAWRVTDATALFDYEAGLSTAAFTVPAWPMQAPTSCSAPPVAGGSQAGAPAPVTTEQAEAACHGLIDVQRKANCIADTAATGDLKFADVYRVTERLANRTRPDAAVLASPADLAGDLAVPVRFDWTPPRSGEGRIETRLCIWPVERMFRLADCTRHASGAAGWPPGVLWGLLVLLFILAVILLRTRNPATQRRLLWLIVAVVLPAVVLALWFGRGSTQGEAVADLQPGRAYFWKVVAEDGQGLLSESPTRRFVMKR